MNPSVPIAPIRPLSRQLANQIAAGEVVERPASILKELLENSLDAGAKRIEIEVERGGVKRILIRDDGHGIAAEEMNLAVAPHATSKIRTLEDLEAIASMGFRGEALASISSVTRMTLTSCRIGQSGAWRLDCGDPDAPTSEPVPVSHPPGTSIETRDLFYNTPARRKFLRSERTEYRHLEDVVKRVALARFDVGFVFKHNQRDVYRLPVADAPARQDHRLGRLCGKTFIQQALRLERQASGLRLWGWVLPPEYARPQADIQFFFVNGRIIKDRVISHALRQAYEDRLHPGRHPAYVLYLELAPHTVDVNVHPTKHEVRFREARLVHDFLAHSLSQSFRDSIQVPPVHTQVPDYVKPAGDNVPASSAPSCEPSAKHPVYVPDCYQPGYDLEQPQKVAESQSAYARVTESTPELEALTVMHPYLIARQALRLLVVDILAAKTALLGHRLKYYYQQGAHSQPLLFPLSLTVTEAQCGRLETDLFTRLGFDLRVLDASDVSETRTVMIRQIPSCLNSRQISPALPLILNGALKKLDETGVRIAESDRVIAVLARCFVTSTGADEDYSIATMNGLLQELEHAGLLTDSDYCRLVDRDSLRALLDVNGESPRDERNV